MSSRLMHLTREDAEEVAGIIAAYRGAIVAMASLLSFEQLISLGYRHLDTIGRACRATAPDREKGGEQQ